MRAMILRQPGFGLSMSNVPMPKPKPEQVLIRISACGVCRTDLHIVDGELPNPKLPLILGHQIVGTVEGFGKKVSKFKIGNASWSTLAGTYL